MTRSLATTHTSDLSLGEKCSITAFDPDRDPWQAIRFEAPVFAQPGHPDVAGITTRLVEISRWFTVSAGLSSRRNAPTMEKPQGPLNKRVNWLRQDAAVEGIAVRPGSESDLRRFILSNRLRRPMLVLSDDGEFRAVWKGRQGERIAILFEGTGQGEVLLFGPTTSGRHRNDLVSSCRLAQMPSLIERFGLAPVWRDR